MPDAPSSPDASPSPDTSPSPDASPSPDGAAQGDGAVVPDGGSDGSVMTLEWPAQAALTVTPLGPTSVKLSWPAAVGPNGVAGFAVSQNGQLLATLSGTTLDFSVTGLTPGAHLTFSVQASDSTGATTHDELTASYTVATPNPALVAPPLDRTVATKLGVAAAFLYSGTDPIQTGVAAGTIVDATVGVVRGHVFDASGAGLPGVVVTVVNHPEFGSTVTQADGEYDMTVNGGQVLRLHFALDGYLAAERLVRAPWQDYIAAHDVALIALDTQVTAIDLTNTSSFQVARGSLQSDSDGMRQATVLVPPGTQATMALADGSTSPLTAMHVRATEFTVGPNGPMAMPAELPETSAYTYAVSLTVDEAVTAGATKVAFSPNPLPVYLENFLGFPAGTPIPSGAYDPVLGAWVPQPNGVVVKILSVNGGTASLDVDGSGTAATDSALAALGITSQELQELATMYVAGQSLWRVPVAHFSNWDWNFGLGTSGERRRTFWRPATRRERRRSGRLPGEWLDHRLPGPGASRAHADSGHTVFDGLLEQAAARTSGVARRFR